MKYWWVREVCCNVSYRLVMRMKSNEQHCSVWKIYVSGIFNRSQAQPSFIITDLTILKYELANEKLNQHMFLKAEF